MMATDSFLNPKTTLNVKGRLVDLSQPAVMAILNLTPDSFYKNSRSGSVEDMLLKVQGFINEGAKYIDLGAYSSRPGATHISVQEEIDRMLPAVEALHKHFPDAILTIDTFRAEVARASILAGAHIINDIAAGELDENMFATVAELQVPYIMMHMKGTPQDMQQDPFYNDVTLEVVTYFIEKVNRLRALGVKDIILDPGFGFAKSIEHNYELLRNMEDLKIFSLPYLVGFSRKSMVYKPLGSNAAEALNGTTVLHTIALQKGASILRAHDVKAAVECINLVKMLNLATP